jgi:uridine kinase
MAGSVVFSESTWQQPVPATTTDTRRAVVSAVAQRAAEDLPGRVLVAIDGRTGAGKTSFGHEVAEHLAAKGLRVLRASLDDFKRPWADRHLYDRESGEGYYRNAFDYDAIIRLMLQPFRDGSPDGVALCGIDPITQIDHSTTRVPVLDDAVLVVDGVFALRDEINDWWTLRVWLEVDPKLSTARGIDRDRSRDGDRTESVHHDRYGGAEAVYLAETNPAARADVMINNADLDAPLILDR